MQATLTKGSISVTLSDVDSYIDNGDKFIVKPNTGCQITGIGTSYGIAGWMLNPPGTNTTDIHTNRPTLPLDVVSTDSLVVTLSAAYSTVAANRASQYWNVPGRSSQDANPVAEAMAIVFVPYTPVTGLLSPPVLGSEFIARFLRSEPIPESLIDYTLLPSSIVVSSLGFSGTEPSVTYLTNLLSPFAGDLYDGWSTDTRTPELQHPGYGTYYSVVVSQALVQLCSNKTVAEKKPLVKAIVNRGLDLIAAFAERRRQIANGGHCQARKALIVLTGHVLNNPYLRDPTSIVGKVFQEDCSFRAITWWFGTWTAGWGYNSTSQTSNGNALSALPSTWGDVNDGAHGTFAWTVNGYMGQTVGSQIGTALAFYLMGRSNEMGSNHLRMVYQFMQGPPSSAQTQLLAQNISIPWGTDYSVGITTNFCKVAWNTYGPTSL